MNISNHSMESLITGTKAGLCIMVGLLASYIPINLLATTSIEDVSIDIKTVVSVSIFGGSITWWLSKKFQKIDDRLDSLEKRNKRKDSE